MAWWNVGVAAVGLISSADSANNAQHDQKVRDEEARAARETDQAAAGDMLEYYRGRDAQSAALQAQANAIAGRVADAQIGLMNQQTRISGEYHDRNKGTFWPLEDTLVKDSQEYDTPERREAKAMSAMADVQEQYGMAQDIQERNLTRMGVNPNSGKYAAMGNQQSLGLASARTAAGNSARDNVELQGWARRMDAASLGRGLASAQATAAGTATSAGNSAVGAAYAPVNAANQATALMGGGLASAYGMQSNANQLGSSAGSGGSGVNWGSQLVGLGSELAGAYYNNQRNTRNSNLSYANGVSAAGGDGLGTFIESNDYWN
jgi:hypothetical protein